MLISQTFSVAIFTVFVILVSQETGQDSLKLLLLSLGSIFFCSQSHLGRGAADLSFRGGIKEGQHCLHFRLHKKLLSVNFHLYQQNMLVRNEHEL